MILDTGTLHSLSNAQPEVPQQPGDPISTPTPALLTMELLGSLKTPSSQAQALLFCFSAALTWRVSSTTTPK